MVKKAREVVVERLGQERGIPVLCDVSGEDWIVSGLQRARPGAPAPVVYTQYEGKEQEVRDWLKKWKSGHEERDLVTDGECTRGWETDSLVAVEGPGEGVENLVMRGKVFVVAVKKAAP